MKSEAKAPIRREEGNYCPSCGYALEYDDLFEDTELNQDVCFFCGQKIEWEGKE